MGGGEVILAHTFEEETHTYRVPGQFVLSTSDIISLNGLADYRSIPKAVLDHASWRGKQLHLAIQFFEEDNDVPEMPAEVIPYFQGYCKFKIDYDFEPVGEIEKEMVYVHPGTEQAVGCTIDLRGTVKGKPFILDAKTSAKQSGKAKAQKLLAWRLQLSSYKEGTDMDYPWWKLIADLGLDTSDASPAGKGIVQVNKEGGYEFHDFSRAVDDDMLWDSAVRLAMAKLANGYQLERR